MKRRQGADKGKVGSPLLLHIFLGHKEGKIRKDQNLGRGHKEMHRRMMKEGVKVKGTINDIRMEVK
jgi:hypothetical protein